MSEATVNTPPEKSVELPYSIVQVPSQLGDKDLTKPFSDLAKTDQKTKVINEINELFKDGGKFPPITSDEYERVLASIRPKEIKPNDELVVKDGKVSYEDFKQTSQDVENVTDKDFSFEGKMPRLLVFPKEVSSDTKEGQAANYLKEKIKLSDDEFKHIYKGNMTYVSQADTIAIRQETLDISTKQEVTDFYAHENGHRLDFASKGYKIALPLGPTADYVKVNDNLIKEYERTADIYAGASGHGKGLISAINNPAIVEDSTHDKKSDRIELITAASANPAAARSKLEAALADFKKNAGQPTNADHGDKVPTPPPAINSQSGELSKW